jgi:hypothetical protein
MGKYTPPNMQEQKERPICQDPELTKPFLPGIMPARQMKFERKNLSTLYVCE